jgi:hypothetical protein
MTCVTRWTRIAFSLLTLSVTDCGDDRCNPRQAECCYYSDGEACDPNVQAHCRVFESACDCTDGFFRCRIFGRPADMAKPLDLSATTPSDMTGGGNHD